MTIGNASKPAAALASLFALGLAACGDNAQAPTAQTPGAESPAAETLDAAAPARPAFAGVDFERLVNADSEPGQWMSHSRDYTEQRFSALDQITTENVSDLGLAWFGDFDTNRGQEATPLYIDGVLYVSTAWSKVYAYDARTGRELWQYDPQVPGEWAVHACCDVVNRGAAAWNGKIYVGTIDGRLNAIDAETGAEIWSVQTTDPDWPYSITGAPRVVKGMVLIGNGGAEFGVRGHVDAYDSETGDLVWRFWTVPGDPALGFEQPELEWAAETWSGEWWRLGGGGTAWDAITYDPVTDLIYLGVGNGSPWNQALRSPGGGDNLFLSSIVAVTPETGDYRWHFQTTPGESWDYTATQPMMTADLLIDGLERRVLMQAPKNGFFYVLDAHTGEFLSGEMFVPVTWAEGLDETGRPIERPEARYEITGEGAIVVPSGGGAHSWHPWSYSPDTGLVYIPAMHTNFPYVAQTEEEFNPTPRTQNFGLDLAAGFALYNEPGAPPRLTEGMLMAWDPVEQREVWRVSFGDGGRGGGTLATAGGLVFQGNSANREFAAYRATDGEKLWSAPVHTGIVAGPITYELDGEQYVAVAAGNNQGVDYYASNGSRLLVFRLGGTAVLPPPPEFTPAPINPPRDEQPAQLVQAGLDLYSANCAICHGDDALVRGIFPDLRRSARLNSQDAFDAVVLHGALAANGMAGFDDYLDETESQAIRSYLIALAQQTPMQPGAFPGAAPVPADDD